MNETNAISIIPKKMFIESSCMSVFLMEILSVIYVLCVSIRIKVLDVLIIQITMQNGSQVWHKGCNQVVRKWIDRLK